MDSSTTVGELRNWMAEFVEERDWSRFHTPKNLAMSIAIETAELMEHFQWISGEDSARSALSSDQLQQIGEEVADVLSYTLSLANALDLDLSTILREKMIANRRKYPADQYRGRFR